MYADCFVINFRYEIPASYVWAYATPLMWIAVILSAFYLLDRRIPVSGSPLAFVLSGIIPYMIFRLVVSSLIRARSAYARLIDMTDLDRRIVFVTVSLIEMTNLCVIFFLTVVLSWLLHIDVAFHDFLAVFNALGAAAILGLGFCMACMAIQPKNDAIMRAIPIILRPSFYLSAIFYIPEELPSWAANILAFNPLVHAIGILREGMFMSYETVAGSSLYVWGFGSLMLLFAWPRLRPGEELVAGGEGGTPNDGFVI